MSEAIANSDLKTEMKSYKHNHSLGRVLGWLVSDKGLVGEHCVELRFKSSDKVLINMMRSHIYDLIPNYKYELTEHQGRSYTTLKSRYLKNVIDECGVDLNSILSFVSMGNLDLHRGFLQAYYTATGTSKNGKYGVTLEPRKVMGQSVSSHVVDSILFTLKLLMDGLGVDSTIETSFFGKKKLVVETGSYFIRMIGFSW